MEGMNMELAKKCENIWLMKKEILIVLTLKLSRAYKAILIQMV